MTMTFHSMRAHAQRHPNAEVDVSKTRIICRSNLGLVLLVILALLSANMGAQAPNGPGPVSSPDAASQRLFEAYHAPTSATLGFESKRCSTCLNAGVRVAEPVSGRRVLAGALIGLVAGGTVGYLYGIARHRSCPESCGLAVGADVLIGAFAGLLAGTFIASGTGKESTRIPARQ
jgi:hypothetical protein